METIYNVQGEEFDNEMKDWGKDMVETLTTENFHPISTIGEVDIYLVNLQFILSNGDTLTHYYKCNWPSPNDTNTLTINNTTIDLGEVKEYHPGVDILKHYQDYLKAKV